MDLSQLSLCVGERAESWRAYEDRRQEYISCHVVWVADPQDSSGYRRLCGYKSIPAGAIRQVKDYETAVYGLLMAQDLPDDS